MTMTAIAHLGKLDPRGGSRPFWRDPVDVAVVEERVVDSEAEARDARDADDDTDARERLASTLRGGEV